ncbi:hypothetical protein [Bacillus sp. B-jedd]|uniref:hypothetical protein n=1 Tax=Bacillus sp. B-jedd TaxID=1476857 RepID=UPI00066209B8|nr:hypothetical protein [Bacillus sp. B-jedd]
MEISKELKNLETSIDEHIIDFSDSDIFHMPIKLAFYELQQYHFLIIALNKERFSCKTFNEKKEFIDKYKSIYFSQRKKYKRILKNLKKRELKILYPDDLKNKEEFFYGFFQKWSPDRSKSMDENIESYMKLRLKRNIKEVNQELAKLITYPSTYINTFSTFIGPSSVLHYRNEMIIYKDVFIDPTESHSFSVFYNENTKAETKNALLNIVAYFNGEPYYYFTENYDFNRKLYELYGQFDLLDILRLRKKNFFNEKRSEPIHLELPIFKQKNGYNMICFNDCQHEMIFELYHASLKQFEPLPRCVFLYRVFEYGSQKHYQPLIRPPKFNPIDALNYYVNEIMSHRYIPLYYIDFGTHTNENRTEIIRRRKAKCINFTTQLKKEAKKIINEWKNHSYLKNKSIGNILYMTGRNATAHGGSGRSNARYDYSMNYKHINDVNIFLELIARYIIEKLNPDFSNSVERNTKHYIRRNQYEEIFEQERGVLATRENKK